MRCPSCGVENDGSTGTCFRCGAGLFVLTEGSLLAERYEILGFVGKGGMGLVYKAQDRALDEVVAIKVLRADIAQSDELTRRFQSEIKLARKVRHRNVCGIHEYGQEQHLRYIVMELIEGVDLRKTLRERGPFQPADAANIALQVAAGLQAIHEEGIVHRDLKTPNIMLDAQGVIRLMDFGIAKQTEGQGGADLTATGHIVGTPEYMSPEQALGQKIDFRSDIYALGIVVFELFTGDVPFRGETPLATIFKQVQEPPPLEKHASLSPPVVAVLAKALAKAPDQRFTSATEMAQALDEATSGLALGAGASSDDGMSTILEARSVHTPTPTPARLEPRPRSVTPATARPALAVPPLVTPLPQTPRPQVPPPASKAQAGFTPRTPTGSRPRAQSGSAVPAPVYVTGASHPGRWLAALGAVALIVAASAVSLLVLWSPGGSDSEPAGGTLPPASVAADPTATTAESASAVAAAGQVANEPPEDVPTPSPTPPAPVTSQPPATAGASSTPRARLAPTPEPTRPRSSRQTVVPVTLSRKPARTPTPAPAPGLLQLLVLPWAEVSVDGKVVGTTPFKPVRLEAGKHEVILSNPSYMDLHKKVTILPGQTLKLEVDLSFEAFPKN